MASLIYGKATTPNFILNRQDCRFTIWTRLTKTERRAIFAEANSLFLSHFYSAARLCLRIAQPLPAKRTAAPKWKGSTSQKAPIPKHQQRSFLARIKNRFYSAEFWLGLSAGLTTRILARMAIESAFASAPSAAVETVALTACAVAGFAAGAVTHLVRVFYRNMMRQKNTPKTHYFSREFYQSAATGMFAGFLGGDIAGSGAATATEAGTLAIGSASGAAIGVFHTLVKSIGLSKKESSAWHILEGAGYGAVGGALGVLSIDMLSASNSLASVFTTSTTTSTNHMTPPQSSLTDTLHMPLTNVAEVTSNHIIPPSTNTSVSHTLTVTQSNNPCHQITHHAHHHAKHIAHHIAPPSETIIVVYQPIIVTPPVVPVVAQAPYAVIPLSQPVAMHTQQSPCPPPCLDQNVPNIQGPCANPGVACAERVSFNGDGDATKVVLEPDMSQNESAHFEVVADSSANDASNVSLVVPFARQGNVLTLMPA